MKDTNMKNNRINSRYAALVSDGATERKVARAQSRFLEKIWDQPSKTNQPLFVNVCFRKKATGKMIDRFFDLGNSTEIQAILSRYDRHTFDQYFSPNVYARPSRKVIGVVMTRLGWCDVDNADPFAFKPKPSIVWRTSPGRTQALWIWDRPYSPAQAAKFSKALAYRHGGDKGGSAPNKLLRLPGSFNHKPEYKKPFIPLVHFEPRPLSKRPILLARDNFHESKARHVLATNPYAHERLAVWKKYRSHLSPSANSVMRHNRVLAADRSKWIFVMIAELDEAGATVDEIASVVWTSPYFRDKYGKDLNALETEISRIVARVGRAK